ncbi:MAG: RNA polymerase sigma-70 factor [Candidatus Promineifilaceae bacterium]
MNEFEAYRPLLFAIAYRMLGSAMDAEDIVQEAYVRYQAVARGEVESPKAYLTTIVTRLALNHLNSARVQRETYLGPWLPEPVLSSESVMAPDPARLAADADSISIAFLVLLENLTAAERAVFILREVFDFPYVEIAAILDKSEGACRKLFSRAKGYMAANRPRFEPREEEHLRLLEQFISATAEGDVSGLTDLLAEEVTLWADGGGKARGAATRPVSGREAVARLLIGVAARFTPPDARVRIDTVNGRPALLVYDAVNHPALVVAVETGDGLIRKVWAMANPDKLHGIA